MIAFYLGLSITVMTVTLLGIGGNSKDIFFDERFPLLNRYSVNDFLPVIVVAYVMLGYFSFLWVYKFMVEGKVYTFQRFVIIVMTFIVIFVSLFVFKLGADTWFSWPSPDGRVYKTIAYSLPQFLGAGIYLGIATTIYLRFIQPNQRTG